MKNKRLGILGGGQLGRMSALAAANLGIETHIFTPEENSPASKVAAHTIVADYTDKQALRDFASGVDVITYEFENIPLETVRFLKDIKPVYPDDTLLEVSQDRIAEKTFLNEAGIPTAKWAAASSPDTISSTLSQWNTDEIILKTTRFGYDGKGQARHRKGDSADTSWNTLGASQLIIEEIIPFECEISMIIARDSIGNTETYGPALNIHKNHILDRSILPAPISPALEKQARNTIQKLAHAIDLVGVMALELFVTKDGELLANEIAPRTHNSGHWSIEACYASQFENHVRAVCGLPLGSAERHHDVEMINLIGDDIKDINKYLNNPHATIHLYGKTEARAGRKMGHITILKQKS